MNMSPTESEQHGSFIIFSPPFNVIRIYMSLKSSRTNIDMSGRPHASLLSITNLHVKTKTNNDWSYLQVLSYSLVQLIPPCHKAPLLSKNIINIIESHYYTG